LASAGDAAAAGAAAAAGGAAGAAAGAAAFCSAACAARAERPVRQTIAERKRQAERSFEGMFASYPTLGHEQPGIRPAEASWRTFLAGKRAHRALRSSFAAVFDVARAARSGCP